MDSSQASRIHAIFDDVVELPLAERAAFLDRACDADERLRRAIDELLLANDRAGAFLADPAISASQMYPKAGLGPGSRIGPYLVRSILGEGGYGIVYLAEQEKPIKRRVALKVIKAGMDTGQVIARFELERQALALMDHPNIARVLDAGTTEDGRPFFVMELVEGPGIADFCRKNELPVRERLALFVEVCDAVQHAHQKGVIHRDLKPSNVLVLARDGRRTPKVIDFGIAKALAESQIPTANITHQTQCIGTPQYMSPEQVQFPQVDVDTRCDVYSLGAVLYELLTDVPAFEPARLWSVALAEMQRVIQEDDPPAPSTRLMMLSQTFASSEPQTGGALRKAAEQVRGDLDWIVMKAMEKDRARRYGTAEALAADIARYLSDEPITAGRPGRLYRLRKFARRNRVLLISGLAVIVAMGLGLAGTTAGLLRARAERNRAYQAQAAELAQRGIAEQQRAAAEEQRAFAQKAAAEAKISERKARESEGAAKAELAKTFAAQTFLYQLVSPPMDPGSTETVPREMLDYVAKQATDAWTREHPEVEAPVRAGLGNGYLKLQLFRKAEIQFHRAVALFRNLEPEGLNLASLLSLEARAIMMQHGYEQCIPLYRESLQRYRRINGRDTIIDTPALEDLAVALANTGKFDEAVSLLNQSLSILREEHGKDHPRVLESMGLLLQVLRAAGKDKDAADLSREIEAAKARGGSKAVAT